MCRCEILRPFDSLLVRKIWRICVLDCKACHPPTLFFSNKILSCSFFSRLCHLMRDVGGLALPRVARLAYASRQKRAWATFKNFAKKRDLFRSLKNNWSVGIKRWLKEYLSLKVSVFKPLKRSVWLPYQPSCCQTPLDPWCSCLCSHGLHTCTCYSLLWQDKSWLERHAV